MARTPEESPDSVESSSSDVFHSLIARLSDTDDSDAGGRIRKEIWDRFGTSGSAFISDMANFSSTSRSLGICHFLKLIHRARQIVAPLVAANNGILLKCDADNCYAYFEQAGDAIQASIDINERVFEINHDRHVDEHIYLSVGIDHGELLLVGEHDFYGNPVNTASKLGEDLAIRGETLVTERALRHSTFNVDDNAERMTARISDIEIQYVRLPMMQSRKGESP